MGHRREEHYQRLLATLKWMLAVNLVLVGILLVLGIRTCSLNRQVKELTAKLEMAVPNFGEPDESIGDGTGYGEDEDSTEGNDGHTSEDNQEANATEEQPTEEMPTDPPMTEEPATEPPTTEPPTTEEVTEAEKRDYIVCLDAGHGGPGGKGAISTLDGRYESHDTLKLTLAVQEALAAYDDITVVMTRTTDVEVDNGVRAQIANDADADLFVSFHRNSNVAGDRGGIEGWIHSSNPDDSRAAGELILAAMEKVGVTHNYGVKSGTWDEPDVNYKIIRLAEMPAVLLEIGYLNFARDNELYDQYYDQYAVAAADAIYAWLKDWVVR